MEAGIAIFVLGVDVGAIIHQNFYALVVTFVYGQMQRCLSVDVFEIFVAVSLDKEKEKNYNITKLLSEHFFQSGNAKNMQVCKLPNERVFCKNCECFFTLFS